MSPKIPRKHSTSTSQSTETTTPIAHRSDNPPGTSIPLASRPFGTPDTTNPFRPRHPEQSVSHALPPTVEVTALPNRNAGQATANSPVDRYWSATPLLRGMQAADGEGFRYVVGRKFVDVEHDGEVHTAHAGLDETLGVYRLKMLTERTPSGPILYKNPEEPTWRLTEQRQSPLKRPADTASEMAQASGLPPKQFKPTKSENPVTDLLQNALSQLHPTLSADQRKKWLQSYNLLPSQLSRLQRDLRTELKIPQWAESHKRLVEDPGSPQRLDALAREMVNELNLKRGARHPWYDPETSMTDAVREALLAKAGYRRNKNNCLYRTDVPAMFRGDDRTPFEIARDDTMLPRYRHSPGASTEKPISSTFSLKEGIGYASAPDPEYLLYNSQTNKHPGKLKSDASDSDSDSSESAEWSDDPDSPVAWDHDRDYIATRTKQTVMFLYVLDTRGLEVVPHEENHLFNSKVEDTASWFPDDEYEGLVSVTTKGIEAERVWLLNTEMTKAAKVKDIDQAAGDRADFIEESTHFGTSNKNQYDALIDKVEALGDPILRLSGNKNEFADDIVWPEL